MTERFKLDELYHMTAYIYSEQNSQRPLSATFSHFVEVCGTLTMQVRKKKREEGSFESALCRALGWFFPLVAKCRIRSIEEVVFQKFPYVCPYCRLAPHKDANCKRVKGTEGTVNHLAVKELAIRNVSKKPLTLGGWMRMFQDIYPRNLDDSIRSTIGLMEELGELAEAVRVFERHPKYLVGELADVFSYLMGLANEYSLSKEADNQGEFNFESEYLARYPGICLACGNRVCTCPSVPAATVGRMAKELDIDSRSLFVDSQEILWGKGNEAARDVLAHVGGVHKLIERVPLDRGDANRSLIMICMAVADSVSQSKPEIANQLRATALKIGVAKTEAGSRTHSTQIHDLVINIRKIIDQESIDLQELVRPLHEGVTTDISRMMQVKRILIAVSSPSDQDRIDVAREIRIATESVGRGIERDRLEIEKYLRQH